MAVAIEMQREQSWKICSFAGFSILILGQELMLQFNIKSTNTLAFINQYLLICHTDIIGKSGGNAKPFKYLLCDIVENENILTGEGETDNETE